MKTMLSISLLLMLSSASLGRPANHWPYDKLTRKADLIVIATPTQTQDTDEKMDFPGIIRDNEPVPALGVNTTFQVLAILKGEPELKSFVLFHLREAAPQTFSLNGPNLVSFDPTQKKRYLLFLKKERDGRFTSLYGQTDPAGAVKDLGVHP